MADALDRPISYERLDIRNGSVERAVVQTQSKMRVDLGFFSYERIRRSTKQQNERLPLKFRKSKLRSLLQSFSLSLFGKSVWEAAKWLFKSS